MQKHVVYNLITPPNRQTTDNKLHDRCFEQAKGIADQFLSDSRLLNFTTHVSDDKNKARIVNLSVRLSGHGSFYLENFGSEHNSHNVVYLYHPLTTLFVVACGGDTTRMNRLTTYTCATMRALYSCLLTDPRSYHAFMLLCDPIWLQLLIKRLLTIRPVIDTMTKGSQLAPRLHSPHPSYS